MLNKVNVTFLGLFLSLHYVYKLIMLLNHDVFFVSLLFMIPELPQFMLNKVNATFLGPFLSLHCLYKLIMWFNLFFFRIIIV